MSVTSSPPPPPPRIVYAPPTPPPAVAQRTMLGAVRLRQIPCLGLEAV